MATIEERANKYAERICEASADKYCYELGYYNGATEQQEIDIQKAIKWHCDTCKKYMSCTGKDKCYVPNELTKAMKGEQYG